MIKLDAKQFERSETIEAVQFDGTQERALAIFKWLGIEKAYGCAFRNNEGQGEIEMEIEESILRATKGDYVVKTNNGVIGILTEEQINTHYREVVGG